ncbi:hypothetical protein R5R35_013418 [Gryllus longicercus]|uniref:Lipid scramblase CLPTM1L n=1 Tax=Gryllus longicercus TaxID=2509291 RepID=A0AAN9WDS7_9ORTH
MQFPSLSIIFSGLFIGYVLHSIWTLGQLFIPPSCQPKDNCIKSYLNNNPKLQLYLYTSVTPHPNRERDAVFIDSIQEFDYTKPTDRELSIVLPESTQKNGTLYLHLFLTSQQHNMPKYSNHFQDALTVHTRVRLTQYHVPEAATFQLLGGQRMTDTEKHNSNKRASKQPPVTHMKTHVTFNILTDNIAFPRSNVPPELMQFLSITSSGEFLPIVQYDFLNNRLRDLVPVINLSVSNVTLSYMPTGIGKLRLMQHLETALHSLISFGFSPKDIDEVKSIFADTNMYLLGLTIFVAAIHLLFDFLAFKHDVNFWRQKDSFAGLSCYTVAWRAFSQTVVLLYLLDEDTSLLVLVPSAIATLIEIWKLQKVVCINITFWFSILPVPKVSFRGSTQAEQYTQKLDAQSMRYLSYLLYPLCIGGAVYSLLYQPHKSWYSWSVHSLVNGVYAFGFLFMLPQLFVNYQLKSVAHLPWRAFMYKAFNTFIDDLFAFIITMPTAHRVACFRDDVVFLIYLYQRWLYPVDKQRVDDGVSEEVSAKKHK